MQQSQQKKTTATPTNDTPHFISYEMWRISHQCSEKAAQSAFKSLVTANKAISTQSKTITSQGKKIESLRRELNLFLEQLSPAQKKARYERLEQEHLQGMFNKGDGACYVDDERVGKVFDTVPLASTQDDIDNQEKTA